MGALWRGGNVCRQLISLCILPRLSMVELAGRGAEAALKILTHYGDLEQNFKFLKEVKILSKFFRINWHAQCQFMSAEATRPASFTYLADCAMPRLIDASAGSASTLKLLPYKFQWRFSIICNISRTRLNICIHAVQRLKCCLRRAIPDPPLRA